MSEVIERNKRIPIHRAVKHLNPDTLVDIYTTQGDSHRLVYRGVQHNSPRVIRLLFSEPDSLPDSPHQYSLDLLTQRFSGHPNPEIISHYSEVPSNP